MTESRHLTDAFDDALRLAHDFHRTHIRKGTEIPYFAHLLQVSGLVLEAGGDEEQAIAALLHDAIEDADTPEEAADRERQIRERFGERVVRLVLGCTDGDPAEKDEMPWRERKERYLHHLGDDADPDVLLISVSDKLHNARAILRDYRAHGEALWGRFRGGKAGTLWYYRALVDTYRARGLEPFVAELNEVVRSLEDAAGAV
jgi:(p)ppGpp synthase/HD superfamily hydrolase